MRTGWPPGLLQDDLRALSRWFAGRLGAMRLAREAARGIEGDSHKTEGLGPQGEEPGPSGRANTSLGTHEMEDRDTTCTHPRTVTHHTGDGTPVEFCPDCGRNISFGPIPEDRDTDRELKIGDRIQDNDPRMRGRTLIVIDVLSCGVRAVDAIGNVRYYDRKRIHTDGKPRLSGLSLVRSAAMATEEQR